MVRGKIWELIALLDVLYSFIRDCFDAWFVKWSYLYVLRKFDIIKLAYSF